MASICCGGLSQLHVYVLASLVVFYSVDANVDYDSTITAGVRTAFWTVTNSECTAVHAVDVTSGSLNWRKSPVDEDKPWALATERRAFFTLAKGPSVSAVSLDSGAVHWTWPPRVGHVWNRQWQTDLSQTSRLATPMPALQAQLLLVHSERDSKVVALDLTTGNLTWEFDAVDNVTEAAATAGLGRPRHLTVTGWEIEGGTSLFLSLTALHTAAPTAPYNGQAEAAATPAARASPSPACLSGSWFPSHWWPSSWWPNHGDDSDDDAGDADVQLHGWVLSVDMSLGECVWVSGPLDLPASQLVLSEPTLLAVSEPREDGGGWLYGLDKSTGAMQYALACAQGPCSVDVSDTRIGLLITGLRQHPPNLSELAAFDLETGTWLWRGLPTSVLASFVVDSCTALAATRPHIYFACTCSADPPARTKSHIPNSTSTGKPGTRLATETESATQATAVQTTSRSNRIDVHDGWRRATWTGVATNRLRRSTWETAKPKPKPAPKPPPPPPPPSGLCAFAVSAETGKIGFEVVLSRKDSVPANATAYDFAPFVMADTVVYRGRLGVYALPQINSLSDTEADPFPHTDAHADTTAHTEQLSSMIEFRSPAAQPQVYSGSLDLQPVSHLTLNQPRSQLKSVHEQQHQDSQPEEQDGPFKQNTTGTVKLQYKFFLPVGLELQSWDWLDLKGGKLLLQVSVPTEPTEEDDKKRCGSEPWYHRWYRSLFRKSSCSLSAAQGGAEDAPLASAWLFALNSQNGSLLWALTTNMSLTPHTQRAVPHEWARGALLLIDGCRPPAEAETDSSKVHHRALGRADIPSWIQPQGHAFTPSHAQFDAYSALLHDDGGGSRTAENGSSCASGLCDSGSDAKQGGRADEGLGDGMSCCLFAVSVLSGEVAWRHCYDMDKACESGVAKHKAANLVYLLLASQVVVATLGCIMFAICHHRARAAAREGAMAAMMQDPDSDDDALLVAVPGAPGASQPARYIARTRHHSQEDSD